MARTRSTIAACWPLTPGSCRARAARGLPASPDPAADPVEDPLVVAGAGVVVAVLGLVPVVLAVLGVAAAILGVAALLGRAVGAVFRVVALVGLLGAPVRLTGRRRRLLRRVAVVGVAGVARAVAVVGGVLPGTVAVGVAGRVAVGVPPRALHDAGAGAGSGSPDRILAV